MTRKIKQSRFVALGSLLALGLGISAGILTKDLDIDLLKNTAPYFDTIGHLWVSLLLILILPVAGSYIVYVFISISNTKEIGKLGGISIAVHSANLLVGVAIGLGLGYYSYSTFK